MAKRTLKRNLVFLTKESNSCYFRVESEQPDGIVVNLRRGTWRLAEANPYTYEQPIERKIGRDCRDYGYHGSRPYGVIGVFDRTVLEHLKVMVSVATSIKARESYGAIEVD